MVAGLHAAHVGTDPHDDAGGLVTQDERQGPVLGADVGAAVGMADAGRDDAHEHLVRTDV